MKAVILAQGFSPCVAGMAPLLEAQMALGDYGRIPNILHIIGSLKKADIKIKEVIIVCAYHIPEFLQDHFNQVAQNLDITISCHQEADERLTSRQTLNVVADYLNGGDDAVLIIHDEVVLNKYPFKEIVKFHYERRAKPAELTVLAVPHAGDPYPQLGGVTMDPKTNVIKGILENNNGGGEGLAIAGIYLVERPLLKLFSYRPTSLPKEIMLEVAREGKAYAYVQPQGGVWLWMNEPEDLLRGLGCYLNFLRQNSSEMLATGEDIEGNVLLLTDRALIGEDCLLGPDVVVFPGCRLDDGVTLSNCILMPEVSIGTGTSMTDTMVSWRSVISRWVHTEGHTILGESTRINDRIHLNGAVLMPGREVIGNVNQPAVIGGSTRMPGVIAGD